MWLFLHFLTQFCTLILFVPLAGHSYRPLAHNSILPFTPLEAGCRWWDRAGCTQLFARRRLIPLWWDLKRFSGSWLFFVSFSEMWGSDYNDSYYDRFWKQKVNFRKVVIYDHTPKISKFGGLQRCFWCSWGLGVDTEGYFYKQYHCIDLVALIPTSGGKTILSIFATEL